MNLTPWAACEEGASHGPFPRSQHNPKICPKKAASPLHFLVSSGEEDFAEYPSPVAEMFRKKT